MSPHLQKSTLVEDVVREIRQMILDGKVEPGEFLPSRKDLAARFGVGVSTVHEAIQALTAVGLVESRPGKGTWVRDDAVDTLIHPTVVKTRLGELNARKVHEARSVIELALTELAAQRATPEDIQRIQAALEAMEAAMEDDETFIAADWQFHLAVARAGRNELLEQFYHLSRKLLSEVIAEFVKIPGVKTRGTRLQQAIAQAIARGDPEEARQAALAHMAESDRLLDEWE